MKYLCWWSFVQGNQVHSQQLSDAKLCLFNVNQKKAFEQIVKLLEIYNEHCVWMGCRKCPFHRYWILIIPWLNKLLNKQTDCIAFLMNNVVVLKKLLNKQMSFLNQKSEFVWTKCHLSGPAQLWSDAFNHWWLRSTGPVISHDLNFGYDIFAINTV